jgi:hypothetical protein
MEAMQEQDFKQLFMASHITDEEYGMYLELWIKYRKLTRNMPQSMSREAFGIHKEIFFGLTKNEKYHAAKQESSRLVV